MNTATLNPTRNSTSVTSQQKALDITRLLRRAMANPDDFVIEMEYADSKGNVTQRTISPIRFVGSDRVLALCLCREEPRQFYLNRCNQIRLKRANEVLMPIEIR